MKNKDNNNWKYRRIMRNKLIHYILPYTNGNIGTPVIKDDGGRPSKYFDIMFIYIEGDQLSARLVGLN